MRLFATHNWFVFLAVAALSACSGDDAASPAGDTASPAGSGELEDLTVDLEPPEYGYQITATPFVVQPGSEIEICEVVRIDPADGETLAWLNGFESRSSDGTHHMNVLAGTFSAGDMVSEGLSKTMLGVGEGQYDCAEMGDLMEEQGAQALYPSQRVHQEGTFPEGVGFPIVVPLVLIINHHYINTSDRPKLVNTMINFRRAKDANIEHVAGFMWGEDPDLLVPAGGASMEGGACVLQQDVNMLAISSHSHERGACFTLNMYDGQSDTLDQTPFFVNKDWESPPIMFFNEQEWTGNEIVPMQAGDAISFACHYVNPEDRTVTDGPSAQDEMCIFVALGYPAPLAVTEVEAIVEEGTIDAFQRFQAGTNIPCTYTTEPHPWPDKLGETMPMDEADMCTQWEGTE